MTGTEALTAYGYVQGEDGRYVRPGKATQEWQPTDAGWLRFDNGAPMPYSVDPESPIQAGLDHDKLPEAFLWIYPDEEIARIYSAAVEAEAERAAAAAAALAEAASTETTPEE